MPDTSVIFKDPGVWLQWGAFGILLLVLLVVLIPLMYIQLKQLDKLDKIKDAVSHLSQRQDAVVMALLGTSRLDIINGKEGKKK